MVKLISRKALNSIVAHLPGVHAEVGFQAKKVQGKAARRLIMHRYSGNARVTLSEGEVDWFVNLVDPAAASIEFGHWVKGKFEDPAKPKYVAGLYILSLAADLDATPKQGPRRKPTGRK